MQDINILVFGASITYGESDSEFGGWVNRMRLHLETDNKKSYNVYNLGISGEVTEETLQRVENECKTKRIRKNDKTLIIFAVGMNDTQDVQGENRVDVMHFQSNINELINKAKKFTKDIVYIGMTNVDETKVVPIPWDKQKSYLNKKIVEFDNAIEKVCSDNEVKYIKMYGLLSIDELSDGLHPNSAGHKKMFEKILCDITELL
ncbi:MAG: GDSL-type esterase/lipase family protein [Firmicutes bacterium]|nr:GDSL-type esterase/lipase family protein [Bacillota bacterium]